MSTLTTKTLATSQETAFACLLIQDRVGSSQQAELLVDNSHASRHWRTQTLMQRDAQLAVSNDNVTTDSSAIPAAGTELFNFASPSDHRTNRALRRHSPAVLKSMDQFANRPGCSRQSKEKPRRDTR